MTQIVLSIPNNDVSFMASLAKRMGWKMETKENLLDNFINSCTPHPEITEEEIQNEIDLLRKSL